MPSYVLRISDWSSDFCSSDLFVLSPVAVVLIGVLFDRFILRRFYTADPILSLLVTFGLAMVAEQLIRIIWGAAPIPASLPAALKGAVIVGDFLFSQYRLMLLAVVAAVLAEIGRASCRERGCKYG